jgi:hypothetical protein
MTDALYFREDDGFIPTDLTIGPWSREHCHAGPPAALLTTEICRLAPDMGMTRITFDIPSAIPKLPCHIETETLRTGRRITHIGASLVGTDGTPYMHASAWLMRKLDDGSPTTERAGKTPRPVDESDPFPLDFWNGLIDYSSQGIEMRVSAGSPFGGGPSTCWFRLLHPVIDGEPTNGFARAAALCDFASGVSAVEPFSEMVAINTDLTIYFSRAPLGDWLALDSRTNSSGLGLGMTDSLVYDASGFVGTTNQSIFFDRVEPPGTNT